jgi:hypothetical protein
MHYNISPAHHLQNSTPYLLSMDSSPVVKCSYIVKVWSLNPTSNKFMNLQNFTLLKMNEAHINTTQIVY